MASSLVKSSRVIVQICAVLFALVAWTAGAWAQGECNEQCFTPLPSAGTDPRLVLEAVRFDENDYVVIKNISGSTINFEGWQICQEQTCAAVPADNPLPQSGKLTIHLNQAGTNTPSDVYIAEFSPLEPTGGEIALFNSDQLDSPSAVVGYVRWGSQAGEGSRESVAMRQWEVGGYVPICAESDHVGIIAVGNVTLVRGWKAQPYQCW